MRLHNCSKILPLWSSAGHIYFPAVLVSLPQTSVAFGLMRMWLCAPVHSPTLRAHLEARLEACRTHPAGERQEADRTQIGAAAGRDALRLLQTEVEQLRSQLGV